MKWFEHVLTFFFFFFLLLLLLLLFLFLFLFLFKLLLFKISVGMQSRPPKKELRFLWEQDWDVDID